jgi:hypothetical protein
MLRGPGAPGPDRGAGGDYLLVPPDHDGEIPDGHHVLGAADRPPLPSRSSENDRDELTDNDHGSIDLTFGPEPPNWVCPYSGHTDFP